MGKHFSVIGVRVKTNNREVLEWNQPLIEGKNLALAGFLLKKINKTNHYLCRYILKPGLKKSTITCTVNTSDIKNYRRNQGSSESIKKTWLKKYFLSNNNAN